MMQSIPCMLCWCMLAGLHIQGTTTALCVRGVICGMHLMTVGYVFSPCLCKKHVSGNVHLFYLSSSNLTVVPSPALHRSAT